MRLRGRWTVVGESPSAWETPGGMSAHLARLNAEFSAFQQEIKDVVLAGGFPDRVDQSLRPLADLYLHSWIPLILRWQAFYRETKDWSGKPWQWTRGPELDRHAAQLSEIRSAARRIMGRAIPTSPHAPVRIPDVPPSSPSSFPLETSTLREKKDPPIGLAIAAIGVIALALISRGKA